MMRWLTILAMIVLAPLAGLASPVRVSSGDHSDFTRIVVEFGSPVNWQMGRTPDGYELRLKDGAAQYDLSKVFDQIGKNRLAGVWADPDSGSLHFGIACACFAMPFEFRPGTVVIDIRNGAPPKGSSFEAPLDGGVAADLVSPAPIRPKPRPSPPTSTQIYDWTAVDRVAKPERALLVPSILGLDDTTPQSTEPSLEPLRQSLIEQLSRGASQGIVDMAKPRGDAGKDKGGGNPAVTITLGDTPDLVVRQKGEQDAPLTAKGEQCVPDDKLDVAAWADDKRPAIEQFGPAMSGLTGEFDRPDPDSVKKAIRFDLNLGFGAEARALMRAFPTDQPDAAIWQSMARIVDGEPDRQPAFKGMAACDTAAALWAILADPEVLSVGQVQKSAILRGFAALPSQLRRSLGPTLVDRFLAMGDLTTATALRDSVVRATTVPGPEIELMQAAIDKASGSPGASEAKLEKLTKQSGPTSADTLAALVLQRAELGQDVSFAQVQAMEEYAKERSNAPDHAKFRKALTLAYAASGDFEKAFNALAQAHDAAPLLWKILGNSGPDSALLNFSTLADGEPPPQPATASATLIADRMLKLGLADQSARWLALVDAPPKLLVARVALAQNDPKKALTLLNGDLSPTAVPVRLEALRQLGDDKAVAALYATLNMPQERWAAVSRTQDWQSLATGGPDVWKAAAASLFDQPAADPINAATIPPLAAAPTQPPPGPLARDKELLAKSATTVDAINSLLNSVKSPVPVTQ